MNDKKDGMEYEPLSGQPPFNVVKITIREQGIPKFVYVRRANG